MATTLAPAAAPPSTTTNTSTSTSNAQQGVDTHTTRVDVINTQGGKILCVSDIRGAISTLNKLAAEHSAVAIIHSGDFGFYEPSSLPSISDRTLRHLVNYTSLISPAFRSALLAANVQPSQMREMLASPPQKLPGGAPGPTVQDPSYFGLSEFPKLLAGEIRLNVPVYTVWGACEDVAVLERIRLAAPSFINVPTPNEQSQSASKGAGEGPSGRSNLTTTYGYSIPNLTVLDEATTRVLLIGGVRLRLFGLGGAVVSHKWFDNGTGNATIAGGGGTMWTTILQIGELVDTAQKVYDATETRLLVSHASPGREGLLAQLALVLKADLTVSAGLHFRYGVSYNEFSVQHDPEAYRLKLEAAKKGFNEVWDTVKTQVDSVVDQNQRILLNNALAVANRVPSSTTTNGATASSATEETSWKNCWNWNLPDAAFGSLLLDIKDGRIGSELRSQGFNFAYRQNKPPPTSSTSEAQSRGVNSNSGNKSAETKVETASIPAVAPTSTSTTNLPNSSQPSTTSAGVPTGPSNPHVHPHAHRGGRGGFGERGGRGAGFVGGGGGHSANRSASGTGRGGGAPGRSNGNWSSSERSPAGVVVPNDGAARSDNKEKEKEKEKEKKEVQASNGVNTTQSKTPAPEKKEDSTPSASTTTPAVVVAAASAGKEESIPTTTTTPTTPSTTTPGPGRGGSHHNGGRSERGGRHPRGGHKSSGGGHLNSNSSGNGAKDKDSTVAISSSTPAATAVTATSSAVPAPTASPAPAATTPSTTNTDTTPAASTGPNTTTTTTPGSERGGRGGHRGSGRGRGGRGGGRGGGNSHHHHGSSSGTEREGNWNSAKNANANAAAAAASSPATTSGNVETSSKTPKEGGAATAA